MYMWQFLFGFTLGVYAGTYYNCKPTLDLILKTIKENIPDEKKKGDQK